MTPCIICIIRLLLPVDLSTYLSFFRELLVYKRGLHWVFRIQPLSSDFLLLKDAPVWKSNPSARCIEPVFSMLQIRRSLLPSERSYYLLCFPFRSCFFVRSYLGVHKGNEFIPPLFTSTVSAQRIARKKTGFLTCGELDDYPLSWYPDLAIYFCFLYLIQS